MLKCFHPNGESMSNAHSHSHSRGTVDLKKAEEGREGELDMEEE